MRMSYRGSCIKSPSVGKSYQACILKPNELDHVLAMQIGTSVDPLVQFSLTGDSNGPLQARWR